MKVWKKCTVFLPTLFICLSLTACDNAVADVMNDDEVIGGDWRVTGVVRDGGTITRNGKDTDVLVCIHSEDAAFYYDSEDQELFDFVEYPTTIQGDPWESYQGIDFTDRNDDGNSDVEMMFDENGEIILMVWFWDADTESFVFQPEESSAIPDESSL